ncbi:MAG TPA: SGNH/GDSL hydrolase family protein [Oculatellaceae cyanobacterium]
MVHKIANYICVGDSMSIDCYPYYELSITHPDVTERIGAASLLFKNQDEIWPEFKGKDLSSIHPDIRFCNLAEDGATTFDFLDAGYLDLVKDTVATPSIVTVTLGGNDLLRILIAKLDSIAEASAEVVTRYNKVMDMLTEGLPRAICVLSTIYDPTDGTGDLPGFGSIKDQLRWLSFVNEGIRDCAKRHSALLVDTHNHFLGHGLSAPPSERWYWAPNIIEPGARGANELRRLWYDILVSQDLA